MQTKCISVECSSAGHIVIKDVNVNFATKRDRKREIKKRDGMSLCNVVHSAKRHFAKRDKLQMQMFPALEKLRAARMQICLRGKPLQAWNARMVLLI